MKRVRRTSLKMYSDKELLNELLKRGYSERVTLDDAPESRQARRERVHNAIADQRPDWVAAPQVNPLGDASAQVVAAADVYPSSCSCGYPSQGPCQFNAPDCIVFPPGKRRPVRIEVLPENLDEEGKPRPLVTEEDVANYGKDDDE